jgi:hypothetical protein
MIADHMRLILERLRIRIDQTPCLIR